MLFDFKLTYIFGVSIWGTIMCVRYHKHNNYGFFDGTPICRRYPIKNTFIDVPEIH